MLSWHPDHFTALGTLIVELSFFGSISKFTFDEPDTEMASPVGLASFHTSNFHIVEHFSLPVVVRL